MDWIINPVQNHYTTPRRFPRERWTHLLSANLSPHFWYCMLGLLSMTLVASSKFIPNYFPSYTSTEPVKIRCTITKIRTAATITTTTSTARAIKMITIRRTVLPVTITSTRVTITKITDATTNITTVITMKRRTTEPQTSTTTLLSSMSIAQTTTILPTASTIVPSSPTVKESSGSMHSSDINRSCNKTVIDVNYPYINLDRYNSIHYCEINFKCNNAATEFLDSHIHHHCKRTIINVDWCDRNHNCYCIIINVDWCDINQNCYCTIIDETIPRSRMDILQQP